jgi:hypothetical protein
MPVYKVSFERFNFSFESPSVPTTEKTISQSLDIVVEFEKITDNNFEAFEQKAWGLLFTEYPSWNNHEVPAGCTKGWSSIIMGRTFTKLSD